MIWLVACADPAAEPEGSETSTSSTSRTEAPTAPDAWVDPSVLDFGAVPFGCTASADVTFGNTGGVPLTIAAIALDSTSGDVTWQGPDTVTLAPGERDDGTLRFAPTETATSATLWLASDDPDSPTLTVSVTGALGERLPDVTDTFVVPDRDAVDILIVSHAATSDSFEERVPDELHDLLDGLAGVDADWRLALVTDEDGCVDADAPAYIDAATPDPHAALDLLLGGLANPSNSALADVLLAALAGADGGCNDGLLRADAWLAVVGVTASHDTSLENWDVYFEVLDERFREPKVHTAAGDYPHDCEWAEATNKWYELTTATGGTYTSICDAGWGVELAEVAGAYTPPRFELSTWPVADTVTVSVDGGVVTGWTYDSSTNEVVFDEIPPGGATVAIAYTPRGDCE